jgi:hypothetical protein
VSIALHLGDLPATRVHELAPVLFEVAATGDEVASALIDRQAEEILVQHRVAATRLGLLSRPHALVLGGGVLRARHPQLHDQVVAGARAQAPYVDITVLDAPPVAGAALLALDALAAGTLAVATPATNPPTADTLAAHAPATNPPAVNALAADTLASVSTAELTLRAALRAAQPQASAAPADQGQQFRGGGQDHGDNQWNSATHQRVDR